jgi:hypothetical protein
MGLSVFLQRKSKILATEISFQKHGERKEPKIQLVRLKPNPITGRLEFVPLDENGR